MLKLYIVFHIFNQTKPKFRFVALNISCRTPFKTFFFCTVRCDKLHNTNQRNAQFSKLIFNFQFLLSPTCFEPLWFILRERVV